MRKTTSESTNGLSNSSLKFSLNSSVMLGNSASSMSINKVTTKSLKKKDEQQKNLKSNKSLASESLVFNKRPEPKPRRLENEINNESDLQNEKKILKKPFIYKLKSVKTEKENSNNQTFLASNVGSKNNETEEIVSDSNDNVLINRIKQLRRVDPSKVSKNNTTESYSTSINKDLMQTSVYRRLKNNNNSNFLNSTLSISESSSSSTSTPSPYSASALSTCNNNSTNAIVETINVDTSLVNTNFVKPLSPISIKPLTESQKMTTNSHSNDNCINSKDIKKNVYYSTKKKEKDVFGLDISKTRQLITQKVFFTNLI